MDASGFISAQVSAGSEGGVPRPDRKPPRRRVLLRAVMVHGAAGLTTPCAILDISPTGARVRLSSADPLSEPLYLIDLTEAAGFCAKIIWRRDQMLGLALGEAFDLRQVANGGPAILRRLWLESIRAEPAGG